MSQNKELNCLLSNHFNQLSLLNAKHLPESPNLADDQEKYQLLNICHIFNLLLLLKTQLMNRLRLYLQLLCLLPKQVIRSMNQQRMRKQYLTQYMVDNGEKLLKKNYRTLNNTILGSMMNYQVEEKQLVPSGCSK